jgi:hypothetical protein
MPRKKLNQDAPYIPSGTPLYNVCFRGGALQGRMTVRGLEGLRPEQIEWVWIVDETRRATPEEIQNFCKIRNLWGRK